LLNERAKNNYSIKTQVYEESHQAINRDSCTYLAKEFASLDQKINGKKPFVFLSASKAIGPLLQEYSQMKQEAEIFLQTDPDCVGSLRPIILRPGLVWHEKERGFSVPLKVATDIGYWLNEHLVKKVSPSSPLRDVLP
jgi:hypothetical protein